MYCQKCGSEIGSDDKFCLKCGHPVNQISSNMVQLAWAPLLVLTYVTMTFVSPQGRYVYMDVIFPHMIFMLAVPACFFATVEYVFCRFVLKHKWKWFHWFNAVAGTALALELMLGFTS